MTITKQMIETHPDPVGIDPEMLAGCIDECFSCAKACTMCADACLSEKMVEMMRRCIRLCLDCADQCGATGRIISRLGEFDERLVKAVLEACATVCEVCEAECRHHAEHMEMEHCAISADSCARCSKQCRALMAQF